MSADNHPKVDENVVVEWRNTKGIVQSLQMKFAVEEMEQASLRTLCKTEQNSPKQNWCNSGKKTRSYGVADDWIATKENTVMLNAKL